MRAKIWGCRGSLATPGPETLTFGGTRLGVIDVETRAIHPLPSVTAASKHIDPHFSADGARVYFIADGDTRRGPVVPGIALNAKGPAPALLRAPHRQARPAARSARVPAGSATRKAVS